MLGEWIREMEFVPITFDHVFISYLPNKDKEEKNLMFNHGKQKHSRFKDNFFMELHLIHLEVPIVGLTPREILLLRLC